MSMEPITLNLRRGNLAWYAYKGGNKTTYEFFFCAEKFERYFLIFDNVEEIVLTIHDNGKHSVVYDYYFGWFDSIDDTPCNSSDYPPSSFDDWVVQTFGPFSNEAPCKIRLNFDMGFITNVPTET